MEELSIGPSVTNMANQPLEDDSDPTYTHFAHHAEFMALLKKFMAIDTSQSASDREDYLEGGLVKHMGNIVCFSSAVLAFELKFSY